MWHWRNRFSITIPVFCFIRLLFWAARPQTCSKTSRDGLSPVSLLIMFDVGLALDCGGRASGFRWDDWFCLFLFTMELPFPPVLSTVYATAKSQHAELCRVSAAHVAQYSPSVSPGTKKTKKQKTARGPGVPQCAGAHIWRNCKIGSAWVFPLPACHMFAVLACEWEAEWAGWGRLSQELFTWLPPCSIGSRHLFTLPPKETVVFGN